MRGDLLRPETAGERSCISTLSQRRWCRFCGLARHTGISGQWQSPLPGASRPQSCLCQRGAWALGATPAAAAAPVTRVLCLHRAAASYFSAATARPSQLSTFVPGVNFRKQVRTPGEGCLMAGHRAVLGRGPWGQAQGPAVK